MNNEIYLDANATSPVLPAAIDAAGQAMREGFGNPSSSHATGLRARAMLDAVRARARRVLGAGEGRLMFNSGATEGIQTAVLSALCAVRARQAAGACDATLLLYGATEHKAVPEALAHWNGLLGTGLELCALPVDSSGRHRLDVLRELLPRAALLCTMAANNETGVVSDLAAIGALLDECAGQAYWMVDSVQALGKLSIDLAATRIDYAPFSGHKLYAPKGIGMLYVRAGAPYTALMAGGGQEDGQRAGTENMSGIAALGAVLAALEDGATFRTHGELDGFRARLAAALVAALPGIEFHAPFEHALPTTLNFSVPGLSSSELLDLFDAAGVRVSSGSACSSAKAAPSYVLEAMGLARANCSAAVRMSFGPLADAAFIDAAVARIADCGAALRASCLLPSSLPPSAHDGVLQLGADGACSWLVLDAASRSCVVIDPLAQLASRIAAFVRCQDYRVRAILDTHLRDGGASVRAALQLALAEQLDRAASTDPLGWPLASEGVLLANGMLVKGIALGAQVLAQVPSDEAAFDTVTYLLGPRSEAGLAAAAVRFAFTGKLNAAAMLPSATLRRAIERLAALVQRDTVLCAASEDHQLLCSTVGAEAAGTGPLAALLALHAHLQPAPSLPGGMMQIEAGGLEQFLLSHPDARLVDVREAYEHAAGRAALLHGVAVHSVPLSRLASHLPDWLGGPARPIVFFCRSGGRSIRAAQCLQRAGYPAAWHLAGGMALGLAHQSTG